MKLLWKRKTIQSYHSRWHIIMKCILLVVQVTWKIGRFKAIFTPLCFSGVPRYTSGVGILSLFESPRWLRVLWYVRVLPLCPHISLLLYLGPSGGKTWAGIANRQWGNCKYRHWVGGHHGGCHLWLQSGERLLLYFASPHRWVRLLRNCQPICKPEPELASH